MRKHPSHIRTERTNREGGRGAWKSEQSISSSLHEAPRVTVSLRTRACLRSRADAALWRRAAVLQPARPLDSAHHALVMVQVSKVFSREI